MTVMTRINRRFENVWASCHIRNSSLNHRDDWTGCVAPPPLSEVNQFEESIYVSVWYDLGRWWGDGWHRRYWRAVRGRTIRWFSIFILFWRALVVCCFVRICSNEMKLNWRFQIKSKKIDLLNKVVTCTNLGDEVSKYLWYRNASKRNNDSYYFSGTFEISRHDTADSASRTFQGRVYTIYTLFIHPTCAVSAF